MKRLILSLAAALLCGQAIANTCSVIQAGATDQSVELIFLDETTGIPTAGLTFESGGIDLEYRRTGAAATDITEATQTAAGAHSDGGFVSVGHGRYRLDLPDAAVAGGAREVSVLGTITGYIMAPCTVALSPPVNVVAVGGTAQTGRDLGASVLLSSGTGSGQISLSSGAVLLQPTQTGVTIPTVTAVTNLHASAATAAELAKVPKSDGTATWNATALGSILTQVAAGLATYDGPADAEMDAAIAATEAAILAAVAALENVSQAEVQAAVEAAAVDVQSINGAEVLGDGTTEDKWRGAE